MIKLRSSILVTLVLAAVLCAVLGPDVASAARFRNRGSGDSGKSPVRRTIGPCTGEPDNGNNGSPIKVTTPTLLGPAGTPWLQGVVSQWAWKRQYRHSSGTR